MIVLAWGGGGAQLEIGALDWAGHSTPTQVVTGARAPKRTPWALWLATALGMALAGAIVWRSAQEAVPLFKKGAATAEAESQQRTTPADPAQAPSPRLETVTFRINSIPTGATVRIGSNVMGITPTTFELPAGESGEATAELTLEARGYQPITFIATSSGPRFDLVQRLQRAARPRAEAP